MNGYLEGKFLMRVTRESNEGGRYGDRGLLGDRFENCHIGGVLKNFVGKHFAPLGAARAEHQGDNPVLTLVAGSGYGARHKVEVHLLFGRCLNGLHEASGGTEEVYGNSVGYKVGSHGVCLCVSVRGFFG